MAAADVCSNEDIMNWLQPDEEFVPDLYIVGFQEIVELNVINVIINHNDDTVGIYKNIMKRNLSKIGK